MSGGPRGLRSKNNRPKHGWSPLRKIAIKLVTGKLPVVLKVSPGVRREIPQRYAVVSWMRAILIILALAIQIMLAGVLPKCSPGKFRLKFFFVGWHVRIR